MLDLILTHVIKELIQMHSGGKMGVVKDSIITWLIDYYFRLKYYSSRHLIIERAGGKIVPHLLSHADYVARVEKIISRAKAGSKPEKVIETAITESINCNYVSFDCGKDETFVRFGRGDGKIMLDYYTLPGNSLENFRYAVMGLLSEMGFYKMRGKEKPLSYFFRLRDFYGQWLLEANFVRDIPMATEFTIKVFKEIYKEDLSRIRVRVG